MATKKTTSRKTATKRTARKSAPAGASSAASKKSKTASKSTGKTSKKSASATKSKTAKKKTSVKKTGTSRKTAPASNDGMTTSRKTVATSTNSKPRKVGGNSRVRAKRERNDTPPPLPKTRLNDKQLNEFKSLLLAKRMELLSDVRMLTKDALGKSRKDSAGDLSSMPIHMADIGSDNWEQDFTLGLIANERQLVREIDDALERVENRTYGICIMTHKPITVARLRAKPWAKYCIEYARQLERRGY